VKVVAVSQRVDVVAGRSERRDALDQRLSEWLMATGNVPVPVPNGLSVPFQGSAGGAGQGLRAWLQAVRPGAVVLSGGNDLGEYPERDDTERHLLAWAKDCRVPVLGICRGMQMMGVWAGGSLKPVQGHVRTRHVLQGSVVGGVNSFHNFALADCPLEFEVSAQAEDGEIEAIRHTSLPWEGWMWHPEREAVFSAQDTQRLRALFCE
jgi:anthranilate/para-aminobenzoate synthase component II